MAEGGIPMLSKRQREVGERLIRGETTQEIAAALRISVYTCSEHIKRLYEKLGVGSRGECVAKLLTTTLREEGQLDDLDS